jgi:putative ATPase
LDSLFAASEAENKRRVEPLAARMRPQKLVDFVGQQHLLADGRLLRRMIDARRIGSILLSGPPGTGKTTLAKLIASETGGKLRTLSATSSGVKEVREVLAWAADQVATGSPRPILFIDEIHRFSRTQQDALLPDVESGIVSLIGATTSNPHFAINGALISRSQLFLLEAISPADIRCLLDRAMIDKIHGLANTGATVDEDAMDFLASACEGDARRALTALEIAVLSTGKGVPVSLDAIKESLGSRIAGYDATGDDHYNVISALIKSVRGSDVNAALYWLARMLEGGEEIRFLCRRLVILASEDIGNADPAALTLAVAAMQACEFVGLPECQLTLSQTVAYLSLAPKSNAATQAIGQARRDVRERQILPVPMSLRDAHFASAKSMGNGEGYLYAHDHPGGIVAMQYWTPSVWNDGQEHVYYNPVDRGFESELKRRSDEIRKRLTPPQP